MLTRRRLLAGLGAMTGAACAAALGVGVRRLPDRYPVVFGHPSLCWTDGKTVLCVPDDGRVYYVSADAGTTWERLPVGEWTHHPDYIEAAEEVTT